MCHRWILLLNTRITIRSVLRGSRTSTRWITLIFQRTSLLRQNKVPATRDLTITYRDKKIQGRGIEEAEESDVACGETLSAIRGGGNEIGAAAVGIGGCAAGDGGIEGDGAFGGTGFLSGEERIAQAREGSHCRDEIGDEHFVKNVFWELEFVPTRKQ